MRVRCPECRTLMAVKMEGLTRGKKAQVTCRCGQRPRFTVPEAPKLTPTEEQRVAEMMEWLTGAPTI